MLALRTLGWDSWELGVILGYTTSSRTAWAIVRPCLLKREKSYSRGASISEMQNQIRRQAGREAHPPVSFGSCPGMLWLLSPPGGLFQKHMQDAFWHLEHGAWISECRELKNLLDHLTMKRQK